METTPYNPSSFPTNGKASGTASVQDALTSAHATVDKMAYAADEAIRSAKPGIERAAQTAHKLVDRAAGAAVPAAEWLGAQGESIKATQKKLLNDTTDYVSANPIKSIGMALAAGFLISRFVR